MAFVTALVFILSNVERVGDDFHMRLRVVRALKGIETATADVWSDAVSSCGIELGKGERYVIHTSLTDGRMSISACSHIQRVPSGEPDPDLPPVAGRVYGQVTRYDVDRIREFESLEPIPAVRLALDRPGGRITAISDERGQFQFADVPPGKHEIAVDAGPGLTPWMSHAVALASSEDCAATQIVLWPAGRLSGRVQTADGRPGSGVYLRLLHEGPAGSRLSELVDLGKTTGPDGRFTFEGLRPDTYVLAVNPEGTDANGRRPYPPAWFGGADRASATRIPLTEGGAVDLDRPFVLPAPLTTRTFTVAVMCRDGSAPPAFSTRAVATDGAADDEYGDTGDDPVRTLTLVRDQAYTLQVSVYIPVGPQSSPRGSRRKEELPATELPAGFPGRHIALVAPFDNCAEPPR